MYLISEFHLLKDILRGGKVQIVSLGQLLPYVMYGAFKDNKNLSYGFLTGIQRIAQESIFSGLNNLTVNSVIDEEYDSFFGFTEAEVKAMLSYY